MSMDAALSRFPLCVSCQQGVDENAAEEPYEIIRGDHWHSRCAREAETFDLLYQRLKTVFSSNYKPEGCMTAPSNINQLQNAWTKLAAPLKTSDLAWRQDGKPTERGGKYFARFVVYVEAGTVRERLDSVVPGEWDLTLEVLPSPPYTSEEDTSASFKARLQILGVIREDVGTGKDYKQAATDAFKRAAVRFGIGHELYSFEQNWVEVDGDSKYAKPVEDPQTAYERRHTSGAKPTGVVGGVRGQSQTATAAAPPATLAAASATASLKDSEPVACPKCGGKCWDNRLTKRNPKAPDYKCQNRSCDGAIWPPKAGEATHSSKANNEAAEWENFPGALLQPTDDLPF